MTGVTISPVCARRPLAMADSARFFDNIAESYALRPVKNAAGYEDTLSRIRKYLTRRSRVLEIGCGTGTTALHLARSARKIVATDIAPKMVAIGERKRAAGRVRNVEFAVCDAKDAPGKEYDAVIAMNMLMLVPDVPAAIRSLKEKVRPGGVVISKSSGMLGGNILYRVAVPVMQLFKKAPAVSYFTNEGLERRFVEAGFEIVESHDYDERAKRRFLVARKPVK